MKMFRIKKKNRLDWLNIKEKNFKNTFKMTLKKECETKNIILMIMGLINLCLFNCYYLKKKTSRSLKYNFLNFVLSWNFSFKKKWKFNVLNFKIQK